MIFDVQPMPFGTYVQAPVQFWLIHIVFQHLDGMNPAIPSSLAASIPKERRKKATAGTCYKKKNAIFVPQYQEIQKPAFHLMFKDKKSYFELSEDFVASSEMQKEYCMHVLQFIWKKKL